MIDHLKKEGKWWEAVCYGPDEIMAYIETLETEIEVLEKQIKENQSLYPAPPQDTIRMQIRHYLKLHADLSAEESIFVHLWVLGYSYKQIEKLMPTLSASRTTIHRRICSATQKIKGMLSQ